jgi:SAM-dependent methyltransferase
MAEICDLILNLGCGDKRIEGAVNIDLRSDVADVVCDVREVGCRDESVDEIVASDLIEHFPASETHVLLSEWRRVLKPGGKLTLRLPNLDGLARLLLERKIDPRAVIRNIYGGHRWGPNGAWDMHHTGWTPDLLADDLNRYGFDVLSNDLTGNMTVVAIRR